MPSTSVVTETARRVDVDRSDEKVELNMEDLYLFSHGTFSNVYKGILICPDTLKKIPVAVKKSWPGNAFAERIPEVEILTILNRYNHKNIAQLLYCYYRKYSNKLCSSMVFEFYPMNLHEVRQQHGPLSTLDIKLYIWQLFRGQAHIEKHWICHRDIKPQNLLIDHGKGILKITDFGSSKIYRVGQPMHHYHVTRYYRAPELILGSTNYGCSIDRWSCGCVFGELLKNNVLLPGRNADCQLQLIIDVLGYPTEEDFAKMGTTRSYIENTVFEPYVHKTRAQGGFHAILAGCLDKEAVNLLNRVLVYDPRERLNGKAFLMENYFDELFDPHTKRNGKPLTAVTRQDYGQVMNGDA